MTLLTLSLSLLLASTVCAPMNRYTYTLLPASTLRINGTTNMHEFSCLCNQRFESGEVLVSEGGGRNLCFQKAELAMKAKSLDCGSQGINRDLQLALKSQQYPHIFLRVHEVQVPPAISPGVWVPITVHASLTLAGTQRNVSMHVQLQRQSDRHIRVRGNYELQLLDFGIQPPTAMLGLIKVNNSVSLDFDLYLEH